MTYRAKTPTFEAVQWTGSNQQEVADFVAPRNTLPVTFRIEDGLLIGRDGSYFSLFLPVGSYAVHGPAFGADVSQAGLSVKSADEFATQFEALA